MAWKNVAAIAWQRLHCYVWRCPLELQHSDNLDTQYSQILFIWQPQDWIHARQLGIPDYQTVPILT